MMKDIKTWSRLDNAAKIFPPTSTRREPKVFRFVCQLGQPVDGVLLQQALDKALLSFPFYRSVLKKGLFWYYFEESELHPQVVLESGPPCAPLYRPDRPGLLFRVQYRKCRINVEVFHALSDGTGAVQFLRTLVYHYLLLRHPQTFAQRPALNGHEASREQKGADAFDKYYDTAARPKGKKRQVAYRIRSARLLDDQLGVIEGRVSTRAVLAAARAAGATLSEWLCALLISSLLDGMTLRERKRPVVLTVPVDFRRYFPSETARNFFGVIRVSYLAPGGEIVFAQVLAAVRKAFGEQLTQANMQALLNQYTAMENHPLVKAIPLALKIPSLKIAEWRSQQEDTAALSNVGRITMPPEMTPLIESFSVYVSTRRPQVCVCSFEDVLSISFSSPLSTTDAQRRFFQRLSEQGIRAEILSNLPGGERGQPHAYLR